MPVQVRWVMQTQPRAVTLDTPLAAVMGTLAGGTATVLPVVTADNRVIGVVTLADVRTPRTGTRHYGQHCGRHRRRRRLRCRPGPTAADLMTSPPVTVTATVSVKSATQHAVRHGVERMPVVDDTGELVGMVDRAQLRRPYARDDAETHQDLANRLASLGAADTVGIAVSDGIATLIGRVESRKARHTIVDATRCTPGVMAVDHLLVIEDSSAGQPDVVMVIEQRIKRGQPLTHHNLIIK